MHMQVVHGALVIGLSLAYCFFSWHILEATSGAAASAMDAALAHVAGGMRPLLEANRSALAVANALPPITTNQSSLSYVGTTLFTAFAMQPAVAEMSYYAGPDGAAAFTYYRAADGQPRAQGIRLVLRNWHEAAMFRRMGIAVACLLCVTVALAVVALLVMGRSMRRSAAREAALGADLARHKEAVQQAERKSMNKSNAFASASHDIRSALAAVAGLIAVSRPEARANPVLADNLSQMDVCTNKLLDILNSILDMGKVESGKMQLEEVEFTMAKVLEESVDMANVTGMAKGIEVVWDPCDFSVLRCGAVVGDCKRVKQILDNLLGNAMKFTHEGNVVLRAWANRPIASAAGACADDSSCGGAPSRLAGGLFRRWKKDGGCADQQNSAGPKSLRNHPDSVEFYLEVVDTGVGIPMEKRQSVFENYVQVKEGHGGTGLGLGIVQSFVRLMGGEISIKYKEPGEAGTCFGLNVFMKLKERPAEGAVEIMIDQGPSSSSSDVYESRLFREASCFKGLHCVLLVHGAETRRILQAWMESLGVKVWLVPGAELLAAAMDKAATGAGGDGAADLCFIPREMLPMARRNSSGRGGGGGNGNGHHHAFGLLVVVDVTDGGFDAICRGAAAMVPRIKDHKLPCRLVCLTDAKTSSRDLLRFKQAVTCDLELRKPIHGSRLSKLLATMKDLHQSYYSPSQVSPGIKGKAAVVYQVQASAAASSEIEELPVEPPRPKVDAERKPLEGMRVLLAEDSRMLQAIQKKVLNLLGATVEIAEDGSVALAMFKSALEEAIGASSQGSAGALALPYDVVFMDCLMPEMNGYEATRRIREEESRHGIRTPIIALTAHSLEEGLQETIQAGMDLHLTKPILKENIVEAVSQICNS
ncbi:probable histidine kinase 2 [Brachypodium distachyon]|uniref:probable histidine kinase 2 n=1 Tax=Brachypodium distachyon TaxID=15368 RepID=UPI00052FE0A3|nr:probable histidine kinase 2 [Brachypodium distachyon]|eukprot:XP_010229919.1 probable histidine kinase 2 [Brachypodium distachyon]